MLAITERVLAKLGRVKEPVAEPIKKPRLETTNAVQDAIPVYPIANPVTVFDENGLEDFTPPELYIQFAHEFPCLTYLIAYNAFSKIRSQEKLNEPTSSPATSM